MISKIMKYIRWPKFNFGDNLNDLIFPSYGIIENLEFNKKGLFSSNKDDLLGLGTLLTKKLIVPLNVLGSGSDGTLPKRVQCFSFVRGNLTADLLGLDRHLAVGDTAYFLRSYFLSKASNVKIRKIGVIPHWGNIICKNDWIKEFRLDPDSIIEPNLPTDEFIFKVSQCEVILSESMHGAILADILRIPFSPITIRKEQPLCEFKWRDWSSMLSLDLCFGDMKNHRFHLSKDSFSEKLENNVKEKLDEFFIR